MFFRKLNNMKTITTIIFCVIMVSLIAVNVDPRINRELTLNHVYWSSWTYLIAVSSFIIGIVAGRILTIRETK